MLLWPPACLPGWITSTVVVVSLRLPPKIYGLGLVVGGTIMEATEWKLRCTREYTANLCKIRNLIKITAQRPTQDREPRKRNIICPAQIRFHRRRIFISPSPVNNGGQVSRVEDCGNNILWSMKWIIFSVPLPVLHWRVNFSGIRLRIS